MGQLTFVTGHCLSILKCQKLGKGLPPTQAQYLKATFSTRLLKSISSILGQYVSKQNVIDQLHHLSAIWQYLQTGAKSWWWDKRLVSVVLVFLWFWDLVTIWSLNFGAPQDPLQNIVKHQMYQVSYLLLQILGHITRCRYVRSWPWLEEHLS